ncbi:hypothetical protein Dimus_004695 [Dionaea muscipula]
MKPNRNAAAATTVKFLCSYDGKILPRPSDGKLRYVGGCTRVISVDRSISFSELMVKLVELCGHSVTLRCQLPSEEFDDVLVTIKSDEDLANIIEVYDRASSISAREMKIRAFLFPPKSLKAVSALPPPSYLSAASSSSSSASTSAESSPRDRRYSLPPAAQIPADHRISAPARAYSKIDAVRSRYYPCNRQANPRPASLVPYKHHRLT